MSGVCLADWVELIICHMPLRINLSGQTLPYISIKKVAIHSVAD